jgi:hypothetical protein
MFLSDLVFSVRKELRLKVRVAIFLSIVSKFKNNVILLEFDPIFVENDLDLFANDIYNDIKMSLISVINQNHQKSIKKTRLWCFKFSIQSLVSISQN